MITQELLSTMKKLMIWKLKSKKEDKKRGPKAYPFFY